MIGNSKADARRLFKHACAFDGCSEFCNREPWRIDLRLPDYTVAGIVNSAFACEVYIKALLIYHGLSLREITGHKLDVLWEKLECNDPNTAGLVKKCIHEWMNLSDDESDEKFYEMLNNISDAFVYWRYIYEKKGGTIHVNFLRCFRIVLKEVCCEKFYDMTWKEYTKGVEDGSIGSDL